MRVAGEMKEDTRFRNGLKSGGISIQREAHGIRIRTCVGGALRVMWRGGGGRYHSRGQGHAITAGIRRFRLCCTDNVKRRESIGL